MCEGVKDTINTKIKEKFDGVKLYYHIKGNTEKSNELLNSWKTEINSKINNLGQNIKCYIKGNNINIYDPYTSIDFYIKMNDKNGDI